jgi:preprotein translocase subunit SecF
LALAVVGGEVIAGFSYALLVGVIVGTYSSLFIAAPTLLYFKICRSPNTLEKAAQA